MQVNLTANTDLHSVEDFKNLVVRQENGVLVRLGEIADVVLGAEDYNTEVRFSGQRAVFMGIFVLPNANSIDVVKRVRAEMEHIQKELPTGMEGRIAYDGTDYINTAIHDVFHTLLETLLIVMRRHLPFPRLVALGHHSGGRDSDLAHRRGLPHAGFRVHDQSAHPARDRAFGRSGGRRRDRRRGKRRAPFARRIDAR